MSIKRQAYNKDYEFRSTEYVNENYPEGFKSEYAVTYHANKRLKRYLVNGIKEFYDSK